MPSLTGAHLVSLQHKKTGTVFSTGERKGAFASTNLEWTTASIPHLHCGSTGSISPILLISTYLDRNDPSSKETYALKMKHLGDQRGGEDNVMGEHVLVKGLLERLLATAASSSKSLASVLDSTSSSLLAEAASSSSSEISASPPLLMPCTA